MPGEIDWKYGGSNAESAEQEDRRSCQRVIDTVRVDPEIVERPVAAGDGATAGLEGGRPVGWPRKRGVAWPAFWGTVDR